MPAGINLMIRTPNGDLESDCFICVGDCNIVFNFKLICVLCLSCGQKQRTGTGNRNENFVRRTFVCNSFWNKALCFWTGAYRIKSTIDKSSKQKNDL